jgi:glycosyltransferase involved in cell wall biosynthesis
MNTAEAADALRRAFPEHRSHPVPALPVGYDAADFAGPEPQRADSAFRIVHTGSFHTEMALSHRRSERLRRLLRGGPEQAVDVLPRSPVFLAQAIRRVIAEDPSLAGRIELHLAGPLTQADRDALAGVPGVHEHGFLRHPETIALMRSADLLFLPMHDLPEGGRVRIFPCKGYEYLASGRPILAALTDGDGRDLMQRAEGAFVVRPADVDEMARVIAREAARPQRHPSCAEARAGVLREVERRYLNERLAETFDTILGAPSVATAQERATDQAIAGGASR